MNAQGPTPPGWYPDSDGGLRWYDGSGWGEETRPPQAPPQPPPPPPERRRRGALIAIVTAVVLLMAGGAAALVLLVGSDDGDQGAGLRTGGTTDVPTEPTEPPTGASTDEPTDTSNPEPGDPAVVVRRFVRAALAGDCDAAGSYLTPDLVRRLGGCEQANLGPNLDVVRSRIGAASIEPGAASVPVTVIAATGTGSDRATYDMRLVVIDGVWKIHDVR